jgi:hypothetical protein
MASRTLTFTTDRQFLEYLYLREVAKHLLELTDGSFCEDCREARELLQRALSVGSEKEES